MPRLAIPIFLIVLCPALLGLGGCRRGPKPGSGDVPPGVTQLTGPYRDLNPRWSHGGKRIAFLRTTPDRRAQLFLTDADLHRPHALLEAELLGPDRPYDSQLARYSSPDTLAWSPDDSLVAFARTEWFQFDDGERLPGTGLWTLNLTSGRVAPLALHPTRYGGLFYYFHAPTWSPDGRYLAWIGEGISGPRALFVRPLAAQKPRDTTPRFDAYLETDWPAWNPDRGLTPPMLLFRQSLVHALAAPPTETLRVLRPGLPAQTTGELCRLHAADWTQSESEESEMSQGRAEKRTGVRTARARQDVVPRIGQPIWSPDGTQIAFTLTPDANAYNRYTLWTVKADGSSLRRVSPRTGQWRGRGFVAPVWIDEQRLGALSPADGGFEVVVLPLPRKSEQEEPERVRRLGTIGSSDCDWSPDRSRIAWAGPPARPGQATTIRLFDTGQ